MKILLCAELCTLTMQENLQKIIDTVNAHHADFYVFGEAFLQGFDALTFEYKYDITVAISENDPAIAAIKKLAREKKCAIGFGFYENDKGAIYSSYMVIDKTGAQRFKYQRISTGWKIASACADYREGKNFGTFSLEGKVFSCFVCGDFWEDSLLEKIAALDVLVDAFLWPVHCDYSVAKWEGGECAEYQKRTAILAKPVFFCNNYCADFDAAKGGAYVWKQGKALATLASGYPDCLSFEF